MENNMPDCLFCKIAVGEISAETVYEDEHVVAFLDIHPRAPGHTLVIPRMHAETIVDLPSDAISPFGEAVKAVVQKIKRALQAEGFNIGVNMNEAGGQAVGHVHVHIIPRWNGDGGGSLHSIVDNPPQESVQEIAERIRKASI